MQPYSDMFLAYLELKQDLFYEKIPATKIIYYLQASLAAGRTAAAEFNGRSINELYNEAGILVKQVAGDGALFQVKLRAQFAYDPKNGSEVTVYTQSINELASGCSIPADIAAQMHLAHEFFHYLELSRDQVVAEQLEPITRIRIFGFEHRAAVQRTSEIAAHAFAKELLGLEQLPNLYDYLYLIAGKQLDAGYLQQQQQLFGQMYL